MEYDKTNSGALFKNDRKETANHPDYTGELNVDGVDHWVSAWIKTAKSGTKFMSLSIRPKTKKPQPETESPVQVGFDDDEVPF
jgi:uncharacterized protein (DUF736 family)